jgi:hypothetical protein
MSALITNRIGCASESWRRVTNANAICPSVLLIFDVAVHGIDVSVAGVKARRTNFIIVMVGAKHHC